MPSEQWSLHEQVGFFEIVALPLYQSMAAVLPGAQPMLNGAMDNYYLWRSEMDNTPAKS